MAFTRGLPKKTKKPVQGKGRAAGQADERKARKTKRSLNQIRNAFKSSATPMLGMNEGGVMKTKGMKKGGMMKSKGYAKGGAMKTKGMAKGGAMKTKGGAKGGMSKKMRAPSSKKSGLFGR